MTPEQRSTARQRLAEWKRMSPQRQQRILSLFQRFKQLPPQAQERLRNRHQWFQALPPEQQRRLRKEWQGLRDARGYKDLFGGEETVPDAGNGPGQSRGADDVAGGSLIDHAPYGSGGVHAEPEMNRDGFAPGPGDSHPAGIGGGGADPSGAGTGSGFQTPSSNAPSGSGGGFIRGGQRDSRSHYPGPSQLR
jgi:hypothetical protein